MFFCVGVAQEWATVTPFDDGEAEGAAWPAGAARARAAVAKEATAVRETVLRNVLPPRGG
jgi:hypothetical protein